MNELLNRFCPVCGGQKAVPFLSKKEQRLVLCAHCPMIYMNPIPSEMAAGIFYNRAGGEYLSAAKLESDYSDVRFERELKLFRKFCPRGSVLDVGCSSGAFLYQLNKRFPHNYRICGTDVSSAPLSYAEKMGVPVIKENFLAHAFAEKFDAVTFWAVMEHLSEPKLFLKKTAEILKPGGLCFILVPNMNSLAVKLLGAKYRYILPEHLNYFSPQALRKFAGNQFKVAGMNSTHFNPLVIWQDLRGDGREVSSSERAKLLEQTTGYKQNPLFKPVKLALAGVEAVLGKLKLADNIVVVLEKLR
jgi:2-polyprenyl-3-methyl-5-hydroxy-6-metoxy-1,4-benzoquinol methylase